MTVKTFAAVEDYEEKKNLISTNLVDDITVSEVQ